MIIGYNYKAKASLRIGFCGEGKGDRKKVSYKEEKVLQEKPDKKLFGTC